MASSPFAPPAGATLKRSRPPLKPTSRKDDPLRPSSQSSICSAETTGTPRAFAAATMAAAPGCGTFAASVCMLAVKTP